MMHKSTFAIAALLLAASHVHAQNSAVVQREFSDRGARFIELAQSSASKPAYRVNAGGYSISFDTSGVRMAQPVPGGATQSKAIGLHSGLSYGFEGGNQVAPQALNPSATAYHWLVGPQSEWRTHLKGFGELAYRNVWPGIDAVFKSDAQGLKYQFEVASGAQAAKVQLRISGAQSARIASDGALEWTLNGVTLRDAAPYVYQQQGSQRATVSSSYRLQQVDASTWLVGFNLGSYDPQLPLVIDPAWTGFSGLMGGNASDIVNAVARDAQQNTWVCGTTRSPDLMGASGGYKGGNDAFIAKFDDTGAASSITYLGGSGDDSCRGIALDDAGNIYIAGGSASSDFTGLGTKSPTGNFNNAHTSDDAFVAKLSSASAVAWSGFIGGTADDKATGIALDSTNRVYVTGFTQAVCTTSTNCTSAFPAIGSSTNYARTSLGSNAFVARVAADGTKLDYVGVIPGDGDTNIGYGIAVDQSTNTAVIVGETNSTSAGLPTGIAGFRKTPNARQAAPGTNSEDAADGFAARVSANGGALEYFTLLTGVNDYDATKPFNADRAFGVTLLADGSALIAGETSATKFPANDQGAQIANTQANTAGGMDGFVVRLTADGTNISFAKTSGSTGYDSAEAVAGMTDGYVALFNRSASGAPQTPTLAEGLLQSPAGGQDGYLVKYASATGAVTYSGYLGSSSDEAFYALDYSNVAGTAGHPERTTSMSVGGVTTARATAFYNGNESAVSNPAVTPNGLLLRLDSDDVLLNMAVGSGNNQSVPILSAFADLSVLVTNNLNAPQANVLVTFTSPVSTQASINLATTATATTNASGIATLSGVAANGFAGSYVVTASAAGKSVNFSLTNQAGTQAPVSVTSSSAQIAYQDTTTLTASGGSGGGAYSFAFDSTDATAATYCQLQAPTSNTITVRALQAGGSCKVIASKAADANYLAQPSTPVTITTVKAAQTGLSVTPQPASIAVGGSVALAVNNTLPGSTTSYVVDPSTAAYCEMSSTAANTVIGKATGACTIQITQTGNTNFSDALLSAQITVTQAMPGALVLNAPTALTFGDAPVTLSVSQQMSPVSVTYSVVSGTCAIVNTNQLQATAAGSCVVQASQVADANYAATSSNPVSVIINKAAQTTALVVTPSAASIAPGATATLSASGGDSQGAISYTLVSGAPSVCTLSGNQITALAPSGTGGVNCVVQATMDGGANYLNLDSLPVTINVANNPQAPISVSVDRSTIQPGAETAKVTASGGSGTSAFAYALLSGQAFCALDTGSGVVTPLAVGSCVVNASKAASLGFDPATSTNSVSITVANKKQDAITLTADKTSIAPKDTAKLTATGGSGTKSFSFAVTAGASFCSVDAQTGVVTATAVGACTLQASNPASTGFDAATSNSVTINVANKPQAPITVSVDHSSIALNGNAQVSASGGSGTIAYRFALVSGSNACTLDTQTGAVKGIAVGACTINAKNAASDGYDEATSSNTVAVSVGKAPQTISFSLPAGPMVLIAPDVALSATTDASGLAVNSFTSKTTQVCEVSGATLKFYTAGTCTVTASQAGDNTYAAAEKDASVQVVLPAGTSSTVAGSIAAGAVSASIVGGDGWVFGPQNASGWEVTGFYPQVSEQPPANLEFPAGLFGFTAINGPKGTAVTIQLTYPITFPSNAEYWKYGKTSDNPTAHWYKLPGAVVSGNTVTFSVTDGGTGDSDLLANSVILDPGGVAINKAPVVTPAATPVPGLGAWAAASLSLLLALAAGLGLQRQRGRQR